VVIGLRLFIFLLQRAQGPSLPAADIRAFDACSILARHIERSQVKCTSDPSYAVICSPLCIGM
jgi:hypothetical protein